MVSRLAIRCVVIRELCCDQGLEHRLSRIRASTILAWDCVGDRPVQSQMRAWPDGMRAARSPAGNPEMR